MLTCSPRVLSHEITCLSIKQYQFTDRDIPLKKSSGVAILVSLRTGMWSPYTGQPTLESHRPKLGMRSSNAKTALLPVFT